MNSNVLYLCHGNFDLLSRAKRQIDALIKNLFNVLVINGVFNISYNIITNYNYNVITKRKLINDLALIRQFLLWLWNIQVAFRYGRSEVIKAVNNIPKLYNEI